MAESALKNLLDPGTHRCKWTLSKPPDDASWEVDGDVELRAGQQPRKPGSNRGGMAEHMRTELVLDAVDMAMRNGSLQPDCIMHSDRGTQYTSTEYRAKLVELGLRHSVGRTGQCWDNALAESFFASLKNDRAHRMVYPTRKKAKADIAKWIELSTIIDELIPHSTTGHPTRSAPSILIQSSQ